MKIKTDCFYFKGDRPCEFHKKTGIVCDECEKYRPIKNKILIIKLGAQGDVLRTTSILQGLREKYKNPHITWITREDSTELLEDNDYIDKIMSYDSSETISRLMVEEFDLVLGLDTSPDSAVLTSLAKGKEKRGFGLNRKGCVYPMNPQSEYWFEMGVSDDLKRKNRRTYQKIMFEIVGIDPKDYEIILNVLPEYNIFAREFCRKYKINESNLIIGLNTGAGERWRLKKWTIEGYLSLIREIKKNLKAQILLFGGPAEVERNRTLLNSAGLNVIDTGSNNTLKQFSAFLNLCDVIVTGDTLALHVALALGKKVVALFGPTSSYEVELYGRGKKIVPDMDCICCYNQDCRKKPNCMEKITVEQVFGAITELIEQ